MMKHIVPLIALLLLSLLGTQGAYGKPCADYLGQQRHSELWDGDYLWTGEWTRIGCTNDWDVIWECKKCERVEMQVVSMVKHVTTSKIKTWHSVEIKTPTCSYMLGVMDGPYGSIEGTHSCGVAGGRFTIWAGPSVKARGEGDEAEKVAIQGSWRYLTKGRAEISQVGKEVKILLTWTGSSAGPGPHYVVEATRKGIGLVGTWRCLLPSEACHGRDYFFRGTIVNGKKITTDATDSVPPQGWANLDFVR